MKNMFFGYSDVYKSPAVHYQTSFQEPVTPVMNGIVNLHDYVFFL